MKKSRPRKFRCGRATPKATRKPPAERASLIVLTNLESVEVKALPKDLPDVLEYDAEKLVEIGDHVTVADLIIPAGVELETPLEHAVATVYEPSALQAANDAGGGNGRRGRC